ncbi:MAG: glycosyltransferase family 4 protein [Deltaproteobacteria bacterium]|nr:glycosyltransferase family 4 protein [Deltaproteobacteria bacterium]
MTKRLNIAVLSRTTYWHGMRGGMDVHGRLLAQGLAARGHRIVFICTRHPSGKTDEAENGIELHYLNDTVSGSRRHGWAGASVRALSDLHRKQPFDLVWSQSYDGFGLTKGYSNIARIPMIATLHGSIQQELTTFIRNVHHSWHRPDVFIKKMTGLLFSYFVTQKPVLRHCRRIITVSRKITEDLQKWFGRATVKKCVTIYNGIDTRIFYPDPSARAFIGDRHAISEKEVVLLTLGRITHEKGHHLAIEALGILRRTVPGIRLLVVGEGEGLSALKLLAKHLGLSDAVIFTGTVDNPETASYYNAADIFVFPTLTVEGLPFVLIEAMACGKPVIASEIGGNGEVIRDGVNGLLIKPGQPSGIADKIRMLISNEEYAKRLREGAEATVKSDFTIERMIDKTLDVMHECVRNHAIAR